MNDKEQWIKSMEMALMYAAALPEEEKHKLWEKAGGDSKKHVRLIEGLAHHLFQLDLSLAEGTFKDRLSIGHR